MLGVFTWPVRSGCPVSGEFPRRARAAPVLAYALACTLGGAGTASLIATVGVLVRSTGGAPTAAVYVLVAGLTLLAGHAQLRGTVTPLPERKRQVPRRWLQWRHPTATAIAFGLMIGSGVLTFVQFAAAYAIAAIILVAPSFATGVLIGAFYGAARGGTLVVTWLGDRFVGSRPNWQRLATERGAIDIVLAAAALLFPALAVLVTL